MKKLTALIFVLSFVFLLAACQQQVVLSTAQSYDVDGPVHSLDIRINAADFSIQQADRFSVESNLKYLTVSQQDGVLSIVEDAKSALSYTNAYLILYVPANVTFDTVKIFTGAGRLTVNTLIANKLTLELGAGDVQINNLTAIHEADISGGTGQITIQHGILQDLELEMGVGELNMAAHLLGESDLSLGVGNVELTLLGGRDNYRIDIDQGIGSISIDGPVLSDPTHFGNGHNLVQIDAGIGDFKLSFQDPE